MNSTAEVMPGLKGRIDTRFPCVPPDGESERVFAGPSSASASDVVDSPALGKPIIPADAFESSDLFFRAPPNARFSLLPALFEGPGVGMLGVAAERGEVDGIRDETRATGAICEGVCDAMT